MELCLSYFPHSSYFKMDSYQYSICYIEVKNVISSVHQSVDIIFCRASMGQKDSNVSIIRYFYNLIFSTTTGFWFIVVTLLEKEYNIIWMNSAYSCLRLSSWINIVFTISLSTFHTFFWQNSGFTITYFSNLFCFSFFRMSRYKCIQDIVSKAYNFLCLSEECRNWFFLLFLISSLLWEHIECWYRLLHTSLLSRLLS